MNKQLAIVIPAYKDVFLRQTLDSIVSQTSKDFTLYIGDDCSPYDIRSIVDDYKDKVNLVYKRFDSNMGGKNLVEQWARCIAMTQGESYIWLFSDDDVMEAGCVDSFLSLPDEIKDNYLVHYNIGVIDEFNQGCVEKKRAFPKVLSAKDYLDEKLYLYEKKGLFSYVVEFVFSRKVYESTGGFQNFDLAWGSDFLTWLKFSSALRGIYSIEADDSLVLWRRSEVNISPDKTHPILMRKLYSLVDNAAFIKEWMNRHELKYSFSYGKFVFGELKRNKSFLSKSDVNGIVKYYNEKVGKSFFSWLAYVCLCLKK